jgi:hypothetical protein
MDESMIRIVCASLAAVLIGLLDIRSVTYCSLLGKVYNRSKQ